MGLGMWYTKTRRFGKRGHSAVCKMLEHSYFDTPAIPLHWLHVSLFAYQEQSDQVGLKSCIISTGCSRLQLHRSIYIKKIGRRRGD